MDTAQQQLIEENRRLRKAIEELSVLNDLARDISSAMGLEEVIQNVVKRSVRALRCQQGTITLINEESGDAMKTYVREIDSTTNQEQFHLGQNILGWMIINKKPLLSNDISSDPRFRGIKADAEMRSVLCVPLLVKNTLIGVLTVFNKKEGEFSEDDKRLLAIIAAQSAQVLENARLYDQEKSFLAIKEQLKLAQKIQTELLPTKAPPIPGYDLAGISYAAQSVGGDYFDYIHMGNECWAVCLGDVTGKGLPASLLMANTQATLRGQTLVTASPGECLRRSNLLLYESTSDEKFVTLFYAVLDPREHTLTFSNAGHDHPYLVRCDGSVLRLKTGGIMLGVIPTMPYAEDKVTLESGDLLVIYSDGVTEAMNAAGEFFGDEAVGKVIQAHRTASAQQVLNEIVAAVTAHVGATPQSDDITIVVLKRT